jgi:hypothetical protein
MSVKLYRPGFENITAVAVANPKNTFVVLTDDQVKSKAAFLLAEVETDVNGNFTVQLGVQQKYNGEAVEVDVYCGLAPLIGARMIPMKVGSRLIMWDTFGTGAGWTVQSIFVAAAVGDVPLGISDPTPIPAVTPGMPWGAPSPHVITPDADSWVAVDQTALDGGFFGLMGFNSDAAIPGGVAPGDGAGVAPSSTKNGGNIKIIFKAGRIGDPPPPLYTNSLNKIRINNWREVNQLNLQQFIGGGAGSCTGLTNDLDILSTTDHELMGPWSIAIVSAAVIPPYPALPYGSGPRGGVGTHHIHISTWPSCSYQVWLYTTPHLTNGINDRSTIWSLVTFCK